MYMQIEDAFAAHFPSIYIENSQEPQFRYADFIHHYTMNTMIDARKYFKQS